MSETSNSQKLAELSRQRLSRARFLRLTGAAVGLSVVPLAASERASDAQKTLQGEPEILTGEEYPIGIWGPPPPEEMTTAEESITRYEQIKNAGFNFVIGGNGVTFV